MKKVLLKIEGLTCPNCAMKLEEMEDTLQGVLSAEASYHKAQLSLVYEEDQISLEAILKEIQRLGYQVRSNEPQRG